MQDGLHVALAEAEHADVARDDAPARELIQVGHRAFLPHGVALARGAGQHEHMLAVCLERAAGRGAPFIHEHCAALGQPGLLFVVRGHLAADGLEKALDAVERGLVQRQLFAEYGRQRLLGQVVQRGAEAAGGDDDVRAVAGGLDDVAQARRVVADHGLVKYVDAELGQALRDDLRIRVDNVAQQDLGADGDQFCVHFYLPSFLCQSIG